MKAEEVQEILDCLSSERIKYHYFKDRYCFELLSREVKSQGGELCIQALRRVRNARFLAKPSVKTMMAHINPQRITVDDIESYWPDSSEAFTLTMDCWGGGDKNWDQTSRLGCSLVLQLNFSSEHVNLLNKLVKPVRSKVGPFNRCLHPVNRQGRITLAWSRIDISFETNEALIEEIQSDWIRNTGSAVERMQRIRRRNSAAKPRDGGYAIECSYENLVEYHRLVVQRYEHLWPEAMLWATIEFIRQELGINKIFYHTYETGRKLKRAGEPPRSLYTKLPEQFGFRVQEQLPLFLEQDKWINRVVKSIGPLAFYGLEMV